MTDKPFAAPREEQEKATAILALLVSRMKLEGYKALPCQRCGRYGVVGIHELCDVLVDLLALSTPSPVPEKETTCVNASGAESPSAPTTDRVAKAIALVPPNGEGVNWPLAYKRACDAAVHNLSRAEKAEAELAALRPSAAPVREGSR